MLVVEHHLHDNIWHQRRAKAIPSLFYSSQIRAGLPSWGPAAWEELRCSQQGAVSTVNLLLIKYLGEIKTWIWPWGSRCGKESRRVLTEKGGVVQKGLCTRARSWAKELWRAWKNLFERGEIKDEMGERAGYCRTSFFTLFTADSEIPVWASE